MAASSRLSLVSPFRIWAVSNLLFIAIVGSSWYTSYRLAAADDQRLATVQAQTLTKSRFDDLRNRRFRDFVEGIGGEFGNLYVRASMGGEDFEFGQPPVRRHCGQVSYQLFGSDPGGRVDVTVCRPFEFAVWPILAVLAAYLVISGLSLLYIRSLDRRATETLAGFLRESGVEVDAGRGLIGIMAEIRGVREQLDRARRREQELAGAQARAELAEQVAHDIRSPLAVLLRVTDGASVGDGNDVPLVRGAVARIRGISDELLARYRRESSPDGPLADAGSSAPAPTDLGPVLRTLIEEKRVELRDRPGVELASSAPEPSEEILSSIHPVEFQRVLSNLINNAAEAIGDRGGRIAVSLFADDDRAKVTIRDDGPGIPPDVLARLGRRGETYGKAGGSGLGLAHARSRVESWGGRLELSSTPGKGTAVVLDLPRVDRRAREAVLIDDDPLTRKNWQVVARRLGRLLRTYASMDAFLEDAQTVRKDVPIYIDSRLKDGVSGADVAQELHRRGYTELFLATGEVGFAETASPHIRGVIGKEPPWT